MLPPWGPTHAGPIYSLGTNPDYADGSRSTSTYSNVTAAALPMKVGQRPVEVRLPSDQVGRIIQAIRQEQQMQQVESPGQAASPLLAVEAASTPETLSPDEHNTITTLLNVANQENTVSPAKQPIKPADPEGVNELPTELPVTTTVDRRGQSHSNYSDVSMHVNCDSYPTCTHVGSDGRVTHSVMQRPSSTVRGRKEGSSGAESESQFVPLVPRHTDI